MVGSFFQRSGFGTCSFDLLDSKSDVNLAKFVVAFIDQRF